MKLIRILLIVGIIFSSIGNLFAQPTPQQIKELKIGDLCPNFKFAKMVNYQKPSAELNDFKGKLVILDFWATWCSPCVAAMPKMDSLETKYKDKLVIIPVSKERSEVVSSFLKNNKSVKSLNLKSVVEDKDLSRYFRYTGYPHEVWIDSLGKVIAITGAAEVNQSNLEKYFAKKPMDVKIKKDIIGFDLTKPLFFGGIPNVKDNLSIDQLIASSVLMHTIDGIPGSVSLSPHKTENTVKLTCTNSNILQLYGVALGMSPKGWLDFDHLLISYARAIYETKTIPIEFFNYEIVLPTKDSLKINHYMAADLNQKFGDLFGIKGGIEKRLVKCWVLKSSGKLNGTSAEPAIGFGITNENGIVRVKNRSIAEFLYLLDLETGGLTVPLVNGTGILGNIDFEMKVKYSDFEAVKEAIRKYGLYFSLEEKEIDMIVIKDI